MANLGKMRVNVVYLDYMTSIRLTLGRCRSTRDKVVKLGSMRINKVRNMTNLG